MGRDESGKTGSREGRAGYRAAGRGGGDREVLILPKDCAAQLPEGRPGEAWRADSHLFPLHTLLARKAPDHHCSKKHRQHRVLQHQPDAHAFRAAWAAAGEGVIPRLRREPPSLLRPRWWWQQCLRKYEGERTLLSLALWTGAGSTVRWSPSGTCSQEISQKSR